MRRHYSLEPLADLRAHQVDAASRELATAIEATKAAETKRQAAEKDRKNHAEATRATRLDERRALEAGALRVRDLGAAAGWELRSALEQRALLQKENDAQVSEQSRKGEEEASRINVADRKGAQDAVLKHRAKWSHAVRKRDERDEEERMEEAWRPRS